MGTIISTTSKKETEEYNKIKTFDVYATYPNNWNGDYNKYFFLFYLS